MTDRAARRRASTREVNAHFESAFARLMTDGTPVPTPSGRGTYTKVDPEAWEEFQDWRTEMIERGELRKATPEEVAQLKGKRRRRK